MNIGMTSLISAWGEALLNFLWQGLLIGMMAALLLRACRQARPQVRYAIACSALLLCFILPMSSVWQAFFMAVPSDVVFVSTQTMADFNIVGRSDYFGIALQDTLHGQMPWLVIAWSLGCTFFCLRMAFGLTWITHARRRSLVNTDASLQSKLNLLAIQFGLRRPIELLISNEIDSPATAGWWKPIVLMPAALATRLPPDLIEALLAHELAHIKRHDYLINLLQSAIEAVLFFHPVVWWLSKQVRIERENIADDLATEILGEPRQLAVALAALDEFQFAGPQLAPAAHGGNLMSRIQRLMKPRQYIFSWKISAALVGLTLACISVYAHDKTNDAQNIVASASGVTASTDVETALADSATAVADAKTAEDDSTTAAEDSATAMRDSIDSADEEVHGMNKMNIKSDSNSRTTYKNDNKHHQSYAVVTAGKKGMMISGSTDDIGAVEKIRKQIAGDFLWFRRSGIAYVVQDSAVVANVKNAWQDSNRISAQMELLGAKMEVHSKVMNDISAKMEAVSGGSQSESEAMQKISKDMELIGSQQEAIGRQMEVLGEQIANAKTDSERKALTQKMQLQSAKMAPLAERMQALDKLMNAQSSQLDQSLQPLDALSKEMDIAAKPLEPLSKQMEVLGEKLEALTQVADEKVVKIIDETIDSGKAVPIGKLKAQ